MDIEGLKRVRARCDAILALTSQPTAIVPSLTDGQLARGAALLAAWAAQEEREELARQARALEWATQMAADLKKEHG